MIELVRPSEAHYPLLARITFQTVAHPPFESEEEMIADRTSVDLSLLILRDDAPIGALRIGPYNGRTALLQFGVLNPAEGGDILRTVLPDLLEAFDDLDSATYEEPYAEAFEGFGFVRKGAVKRVMCPLVRRDVPQMPMRRTGPEDLPALQDLLQAAYDLDPSRAALMALTLFDTPVSKVSSYVGLAEDGSFTAASIIAGREGQKKPCLNHAITHPAHQRKGWGTALVQASMNTLLDMGCTHFDGWAQTSNVGVMPLHKRFGLEQWGPLVYQGDLQR